MKKIISGFVVVLFFMALNGCESTVDNDSGCELTPNLEVDQDQLNEDIEEIDAYLEENNIEAQVDPSGLRYVISQQGEGESATLCDQVSVTYVGTLLSDGSQFDATSDPFTFILAGLITGWQIGIPLIQPGGSMTLYIPSVYGYGAAGTQGIPGDANIVFEIDLVEVN